MNIMEENCEPGPSHIHVVELPFQIKEEKLLENEVSSPPDDEPGKSQRSHFCFRCTDPELFKENESWLRNQHVREIWFTFQYSIEEKRKSFSSTGLEFRNIDGLRNRDSSVISIW